VITRNTIFAGAALILAIGTLTACGNTDNSTSNAAEAKSVATAPVEQVVAAPKTPEELGQKAFARCRTCHTLELGGRHKVGPNLSGIFGKTSGTADGFAYSKAMKEAAIVWDEQSISDYVENPKSFMPGNKMVFIGLRKQADRDNLIAYLKAETQPK
jgi:cytochrome c